MEIHDCLHHRRSETQPDCQEPPERIGKTMEDIIELILSVLFLPFEAKFENIKTKINTLPNKALIIFLKVLLILLPFALIFGLCSYIFKGYWI